jgi:uncharacterized protein
MKPPFVTLIWSICFSVSGHTQVFENVQDSSRELVLLSHEADSARLHRNEFLYWAAEGQAMAQEHRYDESNRCFEQAFYLKVDKKVRVDKAEAYDEQHEFFMLLYLKALNYLETGDLEDAMVECRRLDEFLRPQGTNDQARGLVRNDPLVNFIMGLIFEMNADYDDAAIAYRKAKQSYDRNYQGLFTKHVPGQLLNSLSEVQTLCVDKSCGNPYGKLIFVWNNGLSPEEKIGRNDFKIICHGDKWLCTDNKVKMFLDCKGDTLLSFYNFNEPMYPQADLTKNGVRVPFELLEDINWYSIQTLKKRLQRDGTHVWHSTNWYTLPGNIYYAVVPLSAGINKFKFTMVGNGNITKTKCFTVAGDGKSHFHEITTMEARPLSLPIPESKVLRPFTPFFRPLELQ